jgi:hypothetical protein
MGKRVERSERNVRNDKEIFNLSSLFFIATCFGHFDHRQVLYTVIAKLWNCATYPLFDLRFVFACYAAFPIFTT